MYQILIIGLKLGHIDHCVIGSIHIFRKNIEKKKFGEILFFLEILPIGIYNFLVPGDHVTTREEEILYPNW
jgi:hypothetical protein